MSEIWKPVRNYESVYEISDMGNVRRIGRATGARQGRKLKPFLDKDGYPAVNLSIARKRRRHSVHVLIVESFIRPLQQDEEVDHVDTIKSHSLLGNLEIVTSGENTRRALAAGLYTPRQNMAKRLVLNEDIVARIRFLHVPGQFGSRRIAKALSLNLSTVENVIYHKSCWKEK